MSSGVTYKPKRQKVKLSIADYLLSLIDFLFLCWDLFWNFFAGILLFGLFALPFVLYFMRHSKQWEFAIKFVFVFVALYVCFFITSFMKVRVARMFERLMMNAEEKEFAKITRNLSREKYIAIKTYFKATGTSVESANNFLKSCRGVAFLDAYDKTSILNNVEISKLILDVEREEQIVSCALDILKTY